MHPKVKKSTPGACPYCGMTLESKGGKGEELRAFRDMAWRLGIALFFAIPVVVLDILGSLSQEAVVYEHYGIAQAALCTPVVLGAGSFFFRRGFLTFRVNMFTLIALGVATAFFYSIVATFFPDMFPVSFRASKDRVDLYFDSAAFITVLVLLGQVLEMRARVKTGEAIRKLFQLSPKEASLILENGIEQKVPLENIQRGNRLRVRPGEKIPVDGMILEGESAIDESMITGEATPIVKGAQEKVIGGTVNTTGSFVMRAEKLGNETLLAQIIEMVSAAQRSKAPMQKLADRVAGLFVPIVVGVAVLTFFLWGFLTQGPSWSYGILQFVTVLIIACPCALGLATPVSLIVGMGRGARFGILIKNASALEAMAKVQVLVVDKTGTLTEGKLHLNRVYALDTGQEDRILALAASLEQQSEHPLAQTIVVSAQAKNLPLGKVERFHSQTGYGIQGDVDGFSIAIGNERWMLSLGISIDPFMKKAEDLRRQGQTVLHVAIEHRAAGLLALSDVVKEFTREAMTHLHKNGLQILMLTGDHQMTAQAVAKELNIDAFQAEVLPQDKIRFVKELQEKGLIVAMAGDGINDAPALAQADVGIAMGTGTDIAMESAKITLIKGDLRGIDRAQKLSKATVRNIRQNLFFAFIYNVCAIPIAAGVFYPHFHFMLNPIIASAAMSLSSLSVVWNALRLRRVKL